MIIQPDVKVSINGSIVAITSFTITNGIGKGYNTCALSGINLTYKVGDRLNISINLNEYEFIITEIEYGDFGIVSINGSGTPFLLENQPNSISDTVYLNSDELISENADSVVVHNNIPTIDLHDRVFTNTSTPLSMIGDMVDVIKGDMFEVKGELYLTPFKTIPSLIVAPKTFSTIFDFTYSDSVPIINPLRTITINQESIDVYSDTNIALERDGTDGILLFNPLLNNNPYSITGAVTKFNPREHTITEEITIADTDIFKVKAGILNIDLLLLDGVPYTDYTVFTNTNVVKLHQVLSGAIEVIYKTTVIDLNILQDTTLVVDYLCLELTEDIELSDDDSTTCIIRLLDGLTIFDGGILRVDRGADLSFIFLSDKSNQNLTLGGSNDFGNVNIAYKHRYSDGVDYNIDFVNSITTLDSIEASSSTGVVQHNTALGVDVIYLTGDTNIIEIYKGSSLVSGWVVIDTYNPPYVEIPSGYLGNTLELTYNIDTVDIHIPSMVGSDVITLLDVVACNGITTLNVSGGDSDDSICRLPATFDIDVATQIDEELSSVVGKTVSGDFGNLIVDSRGKITITVSSQAEFVITADTIRENAKIYVSSIGVRYA